jgi:hypothetical protein
MPLIVCESFALSRAIRASSLVSSWGVCPCFATPFEDSGRATRSLAIRILIVLRLSKFRAGRLRTGPEFAKL